MGVSLATLCEHQKSQPESLSSNAPWESFILSKHYPMFSFTEVVNSGVSHIPRQRTQNLICLDLRLF